MHFRWFQFIQPLKQLNKKRKKENNRKVDPS